MKNIHILPTTQPSKLGYISESKTYHLYNNDVFLDELANAINIYITSDEAIKKSDWCFNNNKEMKTEQQIREKYDEMLEHTKLLMDKVRNPDKYEDVNIDNIQEHINGENEQHSMNALMKWVLDIKQ
jgi:hypothetical protein